MGRFVAALGIANVSCSWGRFHPLSRSLAIQINSGMSVIHSTLRNLGLRGEGLRMWVVAWALPSELLFEAGGMIGIG